MTQHPWAQKAAEMAACAGFQSPNAFWQVHDLIFARQSEINEDNSEGQLRKLLREIQSIDEGKLSDCINRQLSLGVVLRDKALGDHLGVDATPTVFINGEKVHFSMAAELHSVLLQQLGNETKDDAASGVITLF